MQLDKPIFDIKNKKTFYINFRNLCNKINRTELEVQLFFNSELNCPRTSIDQNGVLIIGNVYRSNVMMSTIEKYVNTYVLCGQCKSWSTTIIKKKSSTTIECKNCKSKKCI